MRTYFDSKEIAHVWAHQHAPHGNCRASMQFNGPSFYSYGTEIARIITHKGKTAFILNTTGYSSTTSGHQSLVRQAIPDSTIFHVGDIRRGDDLGSVKPSALFDYAIHQAAECGGKAERVRLNKGHYLLEQSNWLKEVQKVNEFFGLRRKVDDTAVKRVGKRLASERRKATIAQKKAEAKRFAEAKEKIEAWLRGDDIDFPYGVNRVYFRVIHDNVNDPGEPYMETSLGVRVPLARCKTRLPIRYDGSQQKERLASKRGTLPHRRLST